MPKINSDMLSTGETAALLGVDRRTVRRYVDDKILRSYPTPEGQHRFRRSDVEALSGRSNSDAPTIRGRPPALQAEREDVLRLQLKADRLHAEKRLADLEAEAAVQKQVQREAAAQEREQARRAQVALDRRLELQKWRSSMMELFCPHLIRGKAPAAMKAEFYQEVQQLLDRFESEQPEDMVQSLIAAVADKVFAPWEEEARAAWLGEQASQAWNDYYWRFRAKGLVVLDEELRTALCPQLRSTMRGLEPGSSTVALYAARQRAVDDVLASYVKKKILGTRSEVAAAGQEHAIAAAAQVVGEHLDERRRQGFLRPSFDSRDIDVLTRIAKDEVHVYLKAEAAKGDLTTERAVQLARDLSTRITG